MIELKLKMGLIGCGRIGTKKHLEAAIKNSDLISLEAVCDLDKEKAKNAADIVEGAGLKKPKVFVDHKKLLEEPLNFVAIATESGYHHDITLDALNAGKHVLVEKPMALSTKDAVDMCETAENKNLKLAVCFQNRFNPPIQELRKKIESKAFGKIFHAHVAVRWNRNKSYYEQAPWRGTWEMDGGVLSNQSTHAIDLLQWMLGGEMEEVYGHIANLNHPYIEAEDLGIGVVKFKNGATGIIEGTSNVYPKNLEETLAIFGEKGTVVIGGLAVNKILTWRFEGEDSHPFMNLPDPETVYGEGHIPLYKDFANAIIEKREPYITGREGMKALEIILGIYQSSLENKPVKFPVNFSTEEMKTNL